MRYLFMINSLGNKLKQFIIIIFTFYNLSCIDEVIRIDYNKNTSFNGSFKRNKTISLTVDFIVATNQDHNRRKGGIKKNGYGWEVASIFFEPEAAEILRNSLFIELNNLGYTVIEHNNNGDIGIEIFLNQVFVEPYHEHFDMFLISVIDAKVIVKVNDLKYIKRIKSIKKDNSLWEINYKKSIENNLGSFTSQVVFEIDDLINKKYSKKK
jgi:hypothetical protein